MTSQFIKKHLHKQTKKLERMMYDFTDTTAVTKNKSYTGNIQLL